MMAESRKDAIDKLVDKLPRWMRPTRQVIIAWAGFMTISILVYIMLSDKDFSFLLTYAACCRSFAFFILSLKMWMGKSGSSVSLKTLESYIFVFVFRLLSISRHEGYLPYDRSGDWFYHVVEFSSLAFCILSIYLLKFRFKATYDESKDCFGNLHVPDQYGVVYIVAPCFLMALFLHPNLNKDFVSDFSWTFSMYLESVSIAPQLFMFTKQAENPIEILVAHCVAALGFARVVEMAFWMFSFHELTTHSGSKMVGYFVLIVQFVHVALMGDFFYYYMQSLGTMSQGIPMQLPLAGGMV